jgi:hypothetical protein
MKKPPSASVSPPTQTTQRVPMRSSKPGCGWASGGSGGGAAAGPPAAASGIAVGSVATPPTGAAAAAAGCSAAPPGEAVSRVVVSGGGTDLACRALACSASIASSRARKEAV